MSVLLVKNWWSLVTRGLMAVGLGIAMLVWQAITPGALVFLFATYATIDGLAGLAGGLRAAETHERPWPLLAEGITGICAGIAAYAWPAITPLNLVYIIALWALLTGLFEIASARQIRGHTGAAWLLRLSGIASLVLGLFVALAPLATIPELAVWLGVYALIFGALLLSLGWQLRSYTAARLNLRRA